MSEPRGPTTEELRARALADQREAMNDWAYGDGRVWAAWASAPLLARPCLACNREQGERMCDLCLRLEVAEASA